MAFENGTSNSARPKTLSERLTAGQATVCAEGYAYECERRGYLSAGAWVPTAVLDHEQVVRAMHDDFVHAGSDVVVAFTYFANHEKMRVVGKENEVERLNRQALKIAREVADETGTLMAGNLCNTSEYLPNDPSAAANVRTSFDAMVTWALEGGADLFIAETFFDYGEAKIALESIRAQNKNIDVVVSLSLKNYHSRTLRDGVNVYDALKMLYDAGATVVGLNCCSGPMNMCTLLREARAKLGYDIRLSASPVPYRTTEIAPTFYDLSDPSTGRRIIEDHNVSQALCSVPEIVHYGETCKELKIDWIGLCCGNTPAMTRTLCDVLGKETKGGRYRPDLSLHYMFGTSDKIKQENKKTLGQCSS